MKRINVYLLISVLALGFSSCWTEDIPEAGAARPQVNNLTATPGDEEVYLSWETPEGWNPTDFIIYYTGSDSETITLRSGGNRSCTVGNLTNGTQYIFHVQAVYGELISNYVTITAKPSTSRFPITALTVSAGDGYVTLSWTEPATTVLSYTLSYYSEETPENIKEQTVEKGTTSVTLDNLINDKNYYFSIVANYAKGASEATTAKAMPTLAIPYILDRETAAKNQPITFTFNTEGYPTATDVKWTFPGDVVKEGTVVEYGFGSTGTQTAKLSASIDGDLRTWTVEVEIREYVIYSSDWNASSSYNGFKGSCPVFSPDGNTIYNITFEKLTQLVAFDLITGTMKWKYTPDALAGSYNPLTVNPVTGDIYFGTTSAGQFYAVSPEGHLLWTFTEAQSMKSTAPAVNAAGTVVYICDASGNTFAIDAASGSKLWSFAAPAAGCGLLVNGNELVVGAGKNICFINASDGSEIARLTMAQTMTDISGFAVAADKTTAYIPNTGGYVSSIDLAQHKILVDGFLVGENTMYEPVVAPNGSGFIGSKDSHVYNVNASLTAVNWSHKHMDSNNAFNYSHPCVDSENRFYITSGQVGNTSYIFDANGSIIEQWSYEAGNDGQKQMGGNNYLDGVLYSAFIGASGSNGLFVGKYVGGERASSWSSHGGDICGSCCLK